MLDLIKYSGVCVYRGWSKTEMTREIRSEEENKDNPAIIFSLAVFENVDFTIANSAGERPSG